MCSYVFKFYASAQFKVEVVYGLRRHSLCLHNPCNILLITRNNLHNVSSPLATCRQSLGLLFDPSQIVRSLNNAGISAREGGEALVNVHHIKGKGRVPMGVWGRGVGRTYAGQLVYVFRVDKLLQRL